MLFTERTGTRRAYAKDPAVVRFCGRYYLYYSSYYEDGGREKLGIGIAVSDDMECWTVAGRVPITQECEKNGIGAPGAIVLNGTLHLFYQTYGNREKDAICHATSSDGLNFSKDETNPVFHPTSDWCAGRAIDADAAVFHGRLFLYFATRDHAMKIQKVGVASAPLDSAFSRGDWKQEAPRAVLSPELEWEGECIEAPAALSREGKIYLFYGGAYNCSPQQIGAAVSADGVSFRRIFAEPFLPAGGKGEWNEGESGHPYVFEDDDGTVWLFYQGTADGGESWYLTRCRISFENGIPVVCERCNDAV